MGIGLKNKLKFLLTEHVTKVHDLKTLVKGGVCLPL
jgi:hypothetical protein